MRQLVPLIHFGVYENSSESSGPDLRKQKAKLQFVSIAHTPG
jgi:hypothetical protein